MKSISKAELLKLIDEHLPDDARIALFSSMAYEVYTVDKEQMDNLFATVTDVFDSEEETELLAELGDTTHILGGA